MTTESPPPVTIRRAESPADYAACQDAQRRAWGLTEQSYVVPIATLVGANLHGGLVLGAFLPDGRAVGLSFAFLGTIEGRLGLYSQLTGVVPEFQGQGLGRSLKHAQFAFAESEGLSCVAWAFDPLQAGNARFNLDTLGARAVHYHTDMYGPRTDALNTGVPTDRLIAVWEPDPAPIPPVPSRPFETIPLLVAAGPSADSIPEVRGLDPSASLLLVVIPTDFNALRASDPERANQWRLAVREAMTSAFSAGYRAVGMVQDIDGGTPRLAYLLVRSLMERSTGPSSLS